MSAGGGGCPSSAFIIALWPLKDSGGALKISPRSVAQIWPSLTHPAGQCVIWVGVQFFFSFPESQKLPLKQTTHKECNDQKLLLDV